VVQGALSAGEELKMADDHDPLLKNIILDVVHRQIGGNDPPETRQTLERLMAAGYARQEAIEMIGSALVEIIWELLQDRKEFDIERYRALLDELG
jgi:hypothetical protein